MFIQVEEKVNYSQNVLNSFDDEFDILFVSNSSKQYDCSVPLCKNGKDFKMSINDEKYKMGDDNIYEVVVDMSNESIKGLEIFYLGRLLGVDFNILKNLSYIRVIFNISDECEEKCGKLYLKDIYLNLKSILYDKDIKIKIDVNDWLN